MKEFWLKNDKTWLLSNFPLAEHYGRFCIHLSINGQIQFLGFFIFFIGAYYYIQSEFFYDWMDNNWYCPDSISWRTFRSMGFAVSIKVIFNRLNQSIIFQILPNLIMTIIIKYPFLPSRQIFVKYPLFEVNF